VQRKFLALCINTRRNYTILGEIDVSTITTDDKLFEEIKNKYHTLRGFKVRAMKLFLLQPFNTKFVKVHVFRGISHDLANSLFRKFTAEDFHRVDILHEPPIIPPEAEVLARNYEYTPCPLNSPPPISPNSFLHYLEYHATENSLRGRTWLNRLPKKLERSLLDLRRSTEIEKDIVGWRVHIIEGPNMVMITVLTVIMVGISGVVSLVYSFSRKDVSGGFAIGAWIVAGWVALVTTLYYQWKE
jgi:hypothetical protein